MTAVDGRMFINGERAWAVSGTSEELRRVAAHDWELRTIRPATTGSPRLAA